MICAVDKAFMSTSLSRDTPIHYMGDGNNVLWELEPQLQSDVAFHRGADISLLSQFAAEQEVLFPPCTMLVVLASEDEMSFESGSLAVNDRFTPAGTQAGVPSDLNHPRAMEEHGKRFTTLRVRPYFM